jgi:small-conductance mechanosensitive channel/CRP-like cAMP-binding protein
MGSVLELHRPLLFSIIAVPLVFLAGLALGRWLRRRQGVRLGWSFKVFCLAFALWLPFTALATLDPGYAPTGAWRGSMRHLTAAVALLGTLFFLALLRRFFWEVWFERHQQAKAPKFVSQLVGLLIFIIAVLVVISVDYGVSIPGVVAGSTVVAAIIGFALQDLLGNIIAGIALEVGKPFKPGDWLVIEGQSLEVMEVNWRSTRLRNNDDVYLDVPNKTISGAPITNLTYPTRQHALRLRVNFEHGVPPNKVKDCLLHAAATGRGVVQSMPARAFLRDFTDSAIVYELKFWVEDESQMNDIMDSVRTNIWYEAQRTGLRLAVPLRTLYMESRQDRTTEALDAARSSIRRHPLFQVLDAEHTDKLLSSVRVLRFGRGERMIEQGAEGRSMFLLLEGEADVLVRNNGTNTRVATLRAGDYCGEMSLLTGEPRSATVIARQDCLMWEIDKAMLGELLQDNDPLVQRLSEALAHRRMENEGVLASSVGQLQAASKQKEYTASFLQRLYSFFDL